MDNMDYDLRSVQEVRDMARLGQIATEQIATYTEEQIDKIIAQFAPQTGKTVEELKATFSEGDIEYFKADAIRENCVKFLCDNAKVEE